ncbi:hypothetical protein BN946_scf184843.g23 [Trametes cinnabarina]|uniref:Thioesterase domain-containing protein n=1 Tax=Pycnoporus cinnabarinus TaxID=5643 RepID=A0A060SDK8_PYCCI|nr:hypothetical protein BN946_scf184843.g23 [Trametes cinnabarina]
MTAANADRDTSSAHQHHPQPQQHVHAAFTTRFVGHELSEDQRAAILHFASIILRREPDKFAQPTASRLDFTEVAVFEREEDRRTQVRAVFHIDLGPDMLNPAGNMHGGCTMFLIDVCSSIALVALGVATHKNARFVSQTLNTVFHAPAMGNARLRIVNDTVSFGARTVSARTEIWDITNKRLVATGVHNQMPPSPPKL